MNGSAEKSTGPSRASVHDQLTHWTQRKLLYFFFDVKGVIPTAASSGMYTREFHASGIVHRDGMQDSTYLANNLKMPAPIKMSTTIARPWNGLVMTPRTTM